VALQTTNLAEVYVQVNTKRVGVSQGFTVLNLSNVWCCASTFEVVTGCTRE
jgi:hypothetical protein